MTTQCPYCIEDHAKRAIDAGASKADVAEAVMVAAPMGTGTTVPKLQRRGLASVDDRLVTESASCRCSLGTAAIEQLRRRSRNQGRGSASRSRAIATPSSLRLSFSRGSATLPRFEDVITHRRLGALPVAVADGIEHPLMLF